MCSVRRIFRGSLQHYRVISSPSLVAHPLALQTYPPLLGTDRLDVLHQFLDLLVEALLRLLLQFLELGFVIDVLGENGGPRDGSILFGANWRFFFRYFFMGDMGMPA
jgi:hypothetical protein